MGELGTFWGVKKHQSHGSEREGDGVAIAANF